MKNLIYKMTSNEFEGHSMEFPTKAAAAKAARWQRKCGWTAKVTDMRTGRTV